MSRYRQPYSLFKRGKYWYYRTYTTDGVRTTAKTTGQTSKNAAKEYCDKLYLSGDLWSSEKTFIEYAFHFYDDNSPYLKDRGTPLSENTIKNYRKEFRNHVLPYFEKKKIGDINYSMLKAFRIHLQETGRNVSGTNSVMNVLKHIIDTAYRDRLIAVNPFSLLEPMTGPKVERDAFTFQEIITLYNNIPKEFQKTIFLMALTGTRISEAVGLTEEDFIIHEQGFIYIHLVKQFNNKKYKKLKTKECRDIPVIPEVKELIGFEHTRLSAFYREFGKIKDSFEKADERLLCFHSIRHFFITNSKSKGVPDIKVEVLAGHSLKGQREVYTNFKAEDLTEILEWQKWLYEQIKKGSVEGQISNTPQSSNMKMNEP